MTTYRFRLLAVGISLLLLVALAFWGVSTYFLPTNKPASHLTAVHGSSVVRSQPHAAPTPFLHRPFYGNQTVGQRTTSFVDHDKPWYDYDGIFVRYDGQKWTNTPIGGCTGGVNCYDGHNGYDLNLRFESVLSAAPGTVIRAGWYTPTDHNSSLGLWAAVDHGNGYVTAYGHLSALTVAIGDKIGTQWQVGTSGTTGSSTGPHLHMATYYLPNWQATDPFGWTGNYPDPNIVPDNYLWADNPGTSYTVPLLSANGNAVYPGATLVDDGTSGWSSTGTWTSDTSSSTDINRNLHWTLTSSGSATATATWQPHLPSSGYYEVGVFVDDNHASSSWAPYTVYSADPNNPQNEISHLVYLDQSHIGSFQGPFGPENTGPQWVSLGTYYFNTALSGRVVLNNATGESGLQLAADGVEFAPVALQASNPTYRFAVSNDGTPVAMLPGTTTNVNLTVQNTSNFNWASSGSGAVQLIYRWLNTQKQVISTSAPVALPSAVTINGTANLTVPVQPPAQSGTYTLQWDMLQGSTVFSQQGAQTQNDTVWVMRYGESFSAGTLPTTLSPGASINLTVNVQNRGAIPWPASGNARVTLGYTWLDASGHAVPSTLVDSSPIGTLSNDVAPGQNAAIPITLHTPVLAGSYTLVYDLQQQGAWFAAQGATPLTISVTVTPNLSKVYYFAEGYTGVGNTESLALTNPSATTANVSVTYLYSATAEQTRTYRVPAQSHSVLNINQEAGANQAVGMIVQSDQPFLAERTIYTQKGGFVASTDSLGSPVLSSSWYYAEGNTTPGWNTLLAVLNPNQQAVTLQVTYFVNGTTRTGSSYTIPARARSTVILNNDLPNQQFAMAVNTSSPVMVERPEYLVNSSLRGGSSTVGATAPQTSWYFGAGNTTSGFSEQLVLANPLAQGTTAQIQYFTVNGSVVSQSVTLPAQSRIQVNVNSTLLNALHATMITASTPIIAERQDFFTTTTTSVYLTPGNLRMGIMAPSRPGSTTSVVGSMTTMGVSATHTSWYLSLSDTTAGHIEAVLVANPGSTATTIQVVYYLNTGMPIIKRYTLAASSCMIVSPAHDVGSNQLVGVAIYADQPVAVEHDVFYNQQGVSGGYASPAVGSN